MLVFSNRTTNGVSLPFPSNGGVHQVQVVGTFGGASKITTRVSQDGLAPTPQVNGVVSEPSVFLIELKPGSVLDFELTGAVAGTNITISVV